MPGSKLLSNGLVESTPRSFLAPVFTADKYSCSRNWLQLVELQARTRLSLSESVLVRAISCWLSISRELKCRGEQILRVFQDKLADVCSLVSVAAGACRQAPCRSTVSFCGSRGWELERQLSVAFQRKLLSTVSKRSEWGWRTVGYCCDEANPVLRKIKGCLAML